MLVAEDVKSALTVCLKGVPSILIKNCRKCFQSFKYVAKTLIPYVFLFFSHTCQDFTVHLGNFLKVYAKILDK